MGFSGAQMRTWKLFVCLSWMCVGGTVAKPMYMVAIPAVLEAGAEAKFCVSLLQPNETLVMTISLNTVLLERTSSEELHTCTSFKVPLVQWDEVQNFNVEVRGDTFYSKEVRKVMIKVFQPLTFVQTDKPIYLPGQTVHFRVITLDTRLRPASRQYNVIKIQDSNLNRIGQWLNESSNSKILQLSYSLNSEAREGTYCITVSAGDQKTTHDFKVEKYVLPRFDTKIKASEEVNIGQEEFKAEVCSKYTHGQPVPGTVELKVSQPLGHSWNNRNIQCYSETKQTDKTGCTTFTIEMSTFADFARKLQQRKFELSAKVEEEGTGISFSQNKNLHFSYKVGTLSFVDTSKTYHKGSNLEGKVKAVHYNNTPIPDMEVYVSEIRHRHSPRVLQNLTTDSDGVAAFSLNTDNFNGHVILNVHSTPTGNTGFNKPFYQEGHHKVSPAQVSTPLSNTLSSLKVLKTDETLPCDREESISIQYTVVGEKQASVDVIYLVLSRGAIVMQGFEKIQVQNNSVSRGKVSFQLRVSPELVPVIQVVAYAVLPSEKVIASSSNFNTEKCFSHKVSLEFSPSSAVPGEETTMQVTAEPDSLCGVSAVDQSVLIKEPGKTLNADKIFDLLLVRKATSIPHQTYDFQCLHSGYFFFHHHPDNKDEPYYVFKSVGLKVATNLVRTFGCLLQRRKHIVKSFFPLSSPPAAIPDVPILARKSQPDEPIQTVRTFFPETWIWDLVDIGESGRKDVTFTAPDTITTWETEAFCLSPQGFGLAPRKEITVFQPFFLELTLPYSIIRGEHFELKASVFNYLSSCIMVTVIPAPSFDFTLTPLSGDQYTSCLCGNERKTLSWTMVPSNLGVVNVTVSAEAVASHVSCNNEIVSVPERGRIDVVTRPLVVKAEGTEITKTKNWLLCPKREALTEEIDLQLPEDVIDGSARASISVLGDIMGRALKNLDGLLRMPYGCGEQNMALLAPNIYILQYLKNTQQLTPTILEKATSFLTSGYQRQLNYKHSDGAYSTFGLGAGNTWLTAFVMRSFAKAQSFIYIDPAKLRQSTIWLQSKQQGNGCFQKSGKLFNNRMKGGVSDEVTLSAYITAAFLEMNMSVNSLSCLKEHIGDLSNTYTTALMAYVFTLAGDMETRDRLLQHLDKVSVKEGNLLHWTQTATDTSASLSVEISSYVLLAKLSASPTTEDLSYASSIIRWLTRQQNHYGGFSSTQDTVVALQALALYATLVFSPDGSSTVTIQSPSDQLTFVVNQNNKLLYQEKSLPDVTGTYSLEVKGTACVSMQVSLHYNIPTPADVTTLKVRAEAKCTSTSHRPKLTLNLNSLYSGKEATTNMVILDIKMLSGFVPDPESLKQLGGALLVDRVEQKHDHVLVYIRELPKDIGINHSLELIQELPVKNLKPAVVKIYDYYQPSDQAETEYIYQCATA